MAVSHFPHGITSHAVVGVVEAVAAAHPELRVTRGRKVLEVRPQVRPAPGCRGRVPASYRLLHKVLFCRTGLEFQEVPHRRIPPNPSCLCQVDWDKGTALAHLLELLGLADPDRVVCLYIGDDRTDEDAFRGARHGSAACMPHMAQA